MKSRTTGWKRDGGRQERKEKRNKKEEGDGAMRERESGTRGWKKDGTRRKRKSETKN